MEILGYTLKQTCSACPEQYDVFNPNGIQVGYIRLRHGYFRLDHPASDGETVYACYYGDGASGEFENFEDREYYLTEAIKALQHYLGVEKPKENLGCKECKYAYEDLTMWMCKNEKNALTIKHWLEGEYTKHSYCSDSNKDLKCPHWTKKEEI